MQHRASRLAIIFCSWGLFLCVVGAAADGPAKEAGSGDPLAGWRQGVRVARLTEEPHHSIHSYYVTTPESPDGRFVLYYSSTEETAQHGEIRVFDRVNHSTVVVSRGIETEDAHRAACQQWISDGRRVAFHTARPDGQWVVGCVNRDGTDERALAISRQKGFGPAQGDLVPLYGPHWNPGEHRDLELLNVETGKLTSTTLTAESITKRYADWIGGKFGERPISIFFPVLSPNREFVFVKLAAPAGGDFRSRKASDRFGIICYDLQRSQFRFMQEDWGHPAWSADSSLVINVGGRLTDVRTGQTRRIPNYPKLPGSHPSLSPDGRLFTSDAYAEPFGGEKGSWIVGVGDVQTGEFRVLHTFNHSRGARSWRPSHPHPVFSPDGKRIYFNVSADQWTRLYVAEAAVPGADD